MADTRETPSLEERLLWLAATLANEDADDIRAAAAELERLRSALEAAREAVELLDRVEVGEVGGWALANVDLFLPGPRYYEWAESVRANRRARRALAGADTGVGR